MENQLQEQMNNSAQLQVVGGNSFDYETRMAALTSDERKELLVLVDKLDPHDVTTIQTYGYELSQTVGTTGDELLRKARADNNSESVVMTNNLLAQLNTLELDGLNEVEPRWKKMMRKWPLVGKMFMSVEQMLTKYDTVAANIGKITDKMGVARTVALRDNSTLESIYTATVSYIEDARKLIMALKLKEKELLQEEARMQEDNMVEPHQLQDMHNFITLVQKKTTDLQVTEASFTRMLYQIRLAQHNNFELANQSEHIVNNVIPMWKQNIAVAIMVQNQKAAAEAERAVREATNKMMVATSATLKDSTVSIAKMNEETTISIEALRQTTQDLIDTVVEVKRIQEEGARKRTQIESELKENTERLMSAVQEAALPTKKH